MVTAHPHPRAPQRPGLARRAARKGGWGGRLPALRTHLNCPGCHSNRRRLEVRSREVAKGSPRSRTPLIHQQRTVAPGKDCHPPTSRTKSREGPRGVSVSTQGKPREQRQPEPPKSLELEKGSPAPARPPPPAEPEGGAGSRKPGKGPEARRPHSRAVITGTCPSRPGSHSH